MIAYFTANYENDICDKLIESWGETARKKKKNQ